MTKPRVILAALGAAAIVPLADAALLPVAFAATDASVAVSQGPQSYSQSVVDEAGVLSDDQVADLNKQIAQYQVDHQRSLMVVFVPDFGGLGPEEYARDTVQANGGNNLAVMVVAPELRQYFVQGGVDWSQSEIDDLDKAVRPHLSDGDWNGAAQAFIDAAVSSGQISGESVAWLGGAAVAAAGAGGGLWAWSRRKRNRDEAEQLESARRIDPTDTDSLARLPLETLEQLAHEAVVATDESLRRAEEELRLARAEFGEQRARPFAEAAAHARRAMDSAYATQDRLGAAAGSDAERRQLLAGVITDCSKAQAALDSQAKDFADNREMLLTAENHIAELMRRTVDVRARIPEARRRLEALRANHSEEALSSVADNPELAEAGVDEAEKRLDQARELADQPAGQQGGVVAAIRDSEHAVEVAERMLDAVEHAEDNLATARTQLPDLYAEIDGEIAQARELAARGRASGAQGDWAGLEALADEATSALAAGRERGTADPLGAFTDLTELDGRLDDALEQAGEATAGQERLLRVYRQQLDAARAAVQSADDLIASRGPIVGSRARGELAAAAQLLQRAEAAGDPRQGADLAGQAARRAQQAARLAKNDYDDYQRRQRRNQSGGNGGAFLAGMLVNGILSSGGRGGFGGFGGGAGGRF